MSYKHAISSISLNKEWPVASSELLSFAELQQDEYFSFINKQDIPTYITTSLQHGEKMAQKHVPRPMKLQDIINTLLKEKISVVFIDKDPDNAQTRAQYIRKPPSIHIYKYSITQLQHFLKTMGTPLATDDIIALHLYHEWFHFLEEKKHQRTDMLLPWVLIKKTGPYKHKKTILRTREIAAHAFTQKALNLSWSPLLLDYLLLYRHQNIPQRMIRQKFYDLKTQYEKIIQPEEMENFIHNSS